MVSIIDKSKAKDTTIKVLNEMNLHEVIDLGCVQILRVCGGWIYWSYEGSKVTAAVFVPQK